MHSGSLSKSNSSIAIVAHDAGGAEIISSLIRVKCLTPQCSYSLSGPANKIFSFKLGRINNESLDEIIIKCDYLLCGSSWDSEHELNAIKLAKFHGKKSIVFLDHWVNYENRFTRANTLTLPDEIWVSDGYAERLAKSAFGKSGPPIKVVENPYLIEARRDIVNAEIKYLDDIDKSTVLKVLFLSEAISEHAKKVYDDERFWGYTEKDALNFFLGNREYCCTKNISLRIRLHPADSKDKYNLKEYLSDLIIQISDERHTLVDDIAWADIIVGCSSMAMVVAIISKKRVICAIPPTGKGFHLPHEGIESLASIVAKHKP